jgi:predicted GNAT superfamily acetyltransferase
VPLLRPVTDADAPDVLALNERNVELLAPLDDARLGQLRGWSDRFDVLESDGEFAGFVVTFGPGTPYDSENYRWFTERHGAHGFYYLDRIVLHEDFRRQGLGGFVYDALETVAAKHCRMALEVNVVPRNDASLAFHERRGYVEVGRLGDPGHLVALMEKTFR